MCLSLCTPHGHIGCKMAAGAGIERPIGPMRGRGAGRNLTRNVGPGAETGIDQPAPLQILKRHPVKRGALRLEDDFAFPLQAQPEQILDNPVDMVRARAGGVDILDPQQEVAVRARRKIMREERRPGMAEMQAPGGAGGKACRNFGHPQALAQNGG